MQLDSYFKKKYRMSPLRLQILRLFKKNLYLSTEQIHQILNKLGIDCYVSGVYRELNILVTSGLIERHQWSNSPAVFSLPVPEDMVHFICEICRNIEAFLEPFSHNLLKQHTQEKEFKPKSYKIYLSGTCKVCNPNKYLS